MVVADPSVRDAHSLLDGLPPEVDLHRLDTSSDPIAQIAGCLNGRRGLSELHILSHGDAGTLRFAAGSVDRATLGAGRAGLETIAAALNDDATVVLYGCSVASGTSGRRFVEALELALGARVVASDRPVGAADLGGDWRLSGLDGVVCAPLFTSAARAAFPGLLEGSGVATFGVVTTLNTTTTLTSQEGDVTISVTRSDGVAMGGVSSGFLDPSLIGGSVSYTLSFSTAIDVTQFQIGEFTNLTGTGDYVFTPDSGTAISLADNSGSLAGAVATLSPADWSGITSMTVSYTGASDWRVGVDNIHFTTSAGGGDTTPPAVSAPDLAAGSDSGISNTDNLTNQSSAVFTGTAEAGASVSLLVDGVTVSSGVAFTLAGGTLTAGAWTLSAFSLSEGSHVVQTVATDGSGNSTTSAGLEVVIDTTGPSTVSVPDLIAASDTGASSTDNVTEDATPTFSGVTEAGSVVTLLVDGSTAAVGVADTLTGTWTLTAGSLAAGSYLVQAVAEDAAGNTGTSGGLGLTVTAPAVSGVATFGVVTTLNTTTTLTSQEGDVTISVTRSDGVAMGGVSSGFLDPSLIGGSVSYTLSFSTAIDVTQFQIGEFVNLSGTGDYVFTPDSGTAISLADDSGSLAGAVAALSPADWSGITSMTVSYTGASDWRVGVDNIHFTTSAGGGDTTPPAVSAPDLAAGSDSGISNTDNLTNQSSAVFTGTAEAGASVSLLVDGVTVSSGVAFTLAGGTLTAGAWTLSAFSLSEGSHVVQTVATDGSGNSTTSAGLEVVIDTTGPSTVSVPDLIAASDTGASSTDNVTEDATPTFSGVTEAGSVVTLLVDGSTAAVGVADTLTGTWTLTAGSLAAGSYLVQAVAEDAAGNTGTSGGLGLTVTAPAVSGVATFGVVTTLNTTTTLTSQEGDVTISVTRSDGVAMGGVSSGFLDPSLIGGSVSYTLSFSTAIDVTQFQIGEFVNLSGTGDYVFTPDSGTAISLADDSGSLAGAVAALSPADWSGITSMTVSYTGASDWRVGVDNIHFTTSAGGGDTTATAVSAPDLAAGSDSGISNTDNLTNQSSAVFTGTAEAGASVSLLVDGVTVSSGVAFTLAGGTLTAGAWTLSAFSLSEGSHVVQTVATDGSGNSTTSAGLEVVIDTTGPSTVSVPDLIAASDTGASSTDNVTEDATPTFSGVTEAGSVVTLLVDGSTAAVGVADTLTGTWTLTAGSLAAGSYLVQAVAEDAAGNTGTSGGLGLTVTAPAVSGVATFGVVTTLNTTTTLTSQEGDVTISVTRSDGVAMGGVSSGFLDPSLIGGSVSYTLSFSTAIDVTQFQIGEFVNLSGTGDYVFTPDSGTAISLADDSGSLAGAVATLSPADWSGITSMTVSYTGASDWRVGVDNIHFTTSAGGGDTTPPAVSAPDLAAGSDSGISNTDNLTNQSSAVFTGTAEAGASVSLLVDGVTVSSGVAFTLAGGTLTAGAWTLSAFSLSEGSHVVQTVATDGSGNSTTSAGLEVVIDTTGPSTVSVPDLIAASDTGASSTDNVTEDATPTFSGVTEAGSVVTLLVDGSTAAVGVADTLTGTWTLTAGSLAAGSYLVQAVAEDAAGNTGTSGGLGLTVTAPAVSGVATFGVVTTLNTTTTLTSQEGDVTISVTRSDGVAMGGVSSGFLDPSLIGGSVSYTLSFSTAIDVTQFQIGEFVNLSGTGDYVFTPDSGTAISLADDSGSLAGAVATLSPADWSGITSMTVSYTGASDWRVGVDNIHFTTSAGGGDTTPPAVSAPDLAAGSDSGISNTDNLTNQSSAVFTGTAEAGASVSLLVDGVTVSSGVAFTLAGGTLTAGAWTLSAFSLSEGSHVVQTVATDGSGNSTTSAGLEVVIDTTGPSTVSVPDLIAASDTGASSTDNVTEDATPTFSGVTEAGSVVTLLVGGSTAAVGVADTLTGTWTLTAGSLAAGSYLVQAVAEDAAGNTGTSGGLGIVISDVSSLTVSAPDLVAGSDTGISTTDNLTNDTTPTFGGNATDASVVHLLANGVTVASAAVTTLGGGFSAWSLTAGSLSAGSYYMQVEATDGVVGTVTSAGLGIVIDTTPPTVSAPDLAAASDSGISNTDNLTNQSSAVFTGTAEAGASVSLLVDGVTVSSGVAFTLSGGTFTAGAWTLSAFSLSEGSHVVQTVATDGSGNSTTSAGLEVVIDTAAPTVSTPDLAVGSDSGISNTDNLTNQSSAVFTGTAEAGASVSLLVDGVTVSSGVAFTLSGGTFTAGAWTLSAFSLSEGSHVVQTVATDAAGNSTTSAGLGVVIDTAAPTVSTPDLIAASDTGVLSTDNVTTDSTPTFSGVAEAGATVTLLVDGLTAAAGVADTLTGTWTLTVGTLATGSYVVQALAEDAAGNVATSAGLAIAIEAPLFGTPGDDTLTGTAGDDTIVALGGDDLVSGLGGNDLLSGGDGNDTLLGDQNADTLVGGSGLDSLFGGGGFDVLVVSGADDAFDTLLGGAGEDTLRSETGAIMLDGFGASNGIEVIESATNVIIGTSNANGIDLSSSVWAVGSGIVSGGAGADTLIGTGGADALSGGSDADLLNGGGGFDMLVGGDGDDTLSGGGNADTLVGGTGADVLYGGGGADVFLVIGAEDAFDTLVGGDGDDTIQSETGAIMLDGFGASNSIEVIESATGIVVGTSNANAIDLSSAAWAFGSGTVSGAAGADTLIGTGGADALSGGSDADLLVGGGGFDVLVGGDGDDTLSGGGNADTLVGGTGADALYGGGGLDLFLVSGAEDAFDALDGGSGADTIRSETGAIMLDGFGASNSIEVIDSATGVVAGTSNANAIDLSSAVWASGSGTVLGGAGDDTLVGTGGADALSGGNDDDVLSGGGGFDTLVGATGNDMLFGGGNADLLSGGAGNDTLSGGGGFDTLSGGAGDDLLSGGAGTNTLIGGAGADTFAAVSGDRIEDLGTDDAIVVTGVFDAGDLSTSFNGTVTTMSLSGGPTVTLVGDYTSTGFVVTDDGVSSTIAIDTVPPTVTAPDLLASSDTGVSDSDDVTEDATPTFVGTAEAGAAVRLLVDGVTAAVGVADTLTGTWTLTAAATLAAGSYSIQAQAEDAAGNVATSGSLGIVIGPDPETSGEVIDGYVAGATVFIDADGDGALDIGESRAVSDAAGGFTITGSGPLVAFGGTDIATGKAFDGMMSAPTGYSVITPVTTLIEKLVSIGAAADVAAAESQVRSQFSIDGSVDLAAFDPIAETLAGNAAAGAVLQASTAIQSTLALSAAVVAGASGGSEATAYAAAASALAAALAADPALDLTSSTAVAGVVAQTAVELGIVDATVLAAVASASTGTAEVIAGLNQTALSSLATGTALVTEMAQITVVANIDAADALASAVADGSTAALDLVVGTYSGASLQSAIDAAELADVDGASVGTDGGDLLSGTDGGDVILGVGGADTLRGGRGDDLADGGAGNDIVLGNRGDDTLYGGAGEDYVHGGKGDDLLIVSGVDDAYDTLNGGLGSDTLRSLDGDIVLDGFLLDSIEVIDSATGVLRGTADANFMYLNGTTWAAGSGTVAAGDGNDWVVGTDGGDTLLGEGDDDRLFGNRGDDSLVGGAGDDFMLGNFGDDTIVAGGGDFAHGGRGDDVLRFDGMLAGDRATLDGGVGTNVLELDLTQAQRADASVQSDLDDLDRWLDRGGRGLFDFDSLDLRLRNIDDYTLI